MQKLQYIQELDFNYYPNEYGGSYYMLFSSYDFYFSFLENTNKKSGPGRPKFDRNALFRCLMLKTLMMPNSYRSLIAKLRHDKDLAKIIGLDPDRIPSASILKKFLHDLDIETLYQINLQLINELRSSGVLNFNKLAVDSVPIESYFRPPTKKEESSTDPDATWGFSKCKGGWYFGYKAHIITDIDSKLGISCIVTRAIESDQKITDSLINLLKKLEIQPRLLLADAGYDSEDNHFKLREELNCIGIIKPNPRRKKSKRYTAKSINKAKKLLKQTTLDKYIPIKKRKREYRQCCCVLQKHRIFKKIYKKRIYVEQDNYIIKNVLGLEKKKIIGLINMQKEVLLRCIVLLAIAIVANRLGIPEVMRSPRFFQN